MDSRRPLTFAMANDCLKLTTPGEQKACLRKKINSFSERATRFHQDIRDAILDAKDAGIDYKFTQITAILKDLTKKAPFSIGTFICELIVSILLGPVLDRLVGKFVIGPLTAIGEAREGLDQVTKTALSDAQISRLKDRPMSHETGKALAELGVSTLALHKAGEVPLSFAPRDSYLKGMWSGIAIDSFESLYHKLLEVAQTPDASPVDGAPLSFASTDIDYEPTPLEFISKQARSYFSLQERINDITRYTLETFLAFADKKDTLNRYQSVLDGLNAAFDDYAREDAKREINNIVKMVLALFYFGDPKNWGSAKDTIELGPKKTEISTQAHDLIEDPKGISPSDKLVVYPYRIKIPADLKDVLLRNILIPGEKMSFIKFYMRLKSDYYSRPVFTGEGYGVDKKLSHSYMELRPDVDISDPLSPWYTAEETAFYQLQLWMQRVYDALTSKSYDNFFMTLLANRGKLPQAPMFPLTGLPAR